MQPYKQNTGLNPGQYRHQSYGTDNSSGKNKEAETTVLQGQGRATRQAPQQTSHPESTYQNYALDRKRVEEQIGRQEVQQQPVRKTQSQPAGNNKGGETRSLTTQSGHYRYNGPVTNYGATPESQEPPKDQEASWWSNLFNK